MRIKYFKETDTAVLEFSDARVAETREVSEDIYLDLDEDGKLVSMTVEHAAASASFPAVEVEEVASASTVGIAWWGIHCRRGQARIRRRVDQTLGQIWRIVL